MKWNSITINIHSISEKKMDMNQIIYCVIKKYKFPIVIHIQEHWKSLISQMPIIKNYTCKGFVPGHTKFSDRICAGLASYIRNDWANKIHQRKTDNVNYLILQCWDMKHTEYNVYIPNKEEIYINEINKTFQELDINMKSYNKMNMTQSLTGDTNCHCGELTGDYKLDDNGKKLIKFANDNNVFIVNSNENYAKSTFHGLWGDSRKNKINLMKINDKPSVIDLYMVKRNNLLIEIICKVIEIFLPTDHYAVYGEFTKLLKSVKNLPNLNRYYYAPFICKFVKKNNSEFLEQISDKIVYEFRENKINNTLINYKKYELSRINYNNKFVCNKLCNTWNYVFMDILLKNNCIYYTKAPVEFYRQRLYNKQHPELRMILNRIDKSITNGNESECERLTLRFIETREFIMKYKLKNLVDQLENNYTNDNIRFWKIIKAMNPLEEIPLKLLDGSIVYGQEDKIYEYQNYINYLYKKSSIITKTYLVIETLIITLPSFIISISLYSCP